MPATLRSHQMRQSIPSRIYNAANSEDDIFSQEFESEAGFSCGDSLIADSSNESMGAKLTASSAQYAAELAMAGIYHVGPTAQRPVNVSELGQYLQRDRGDLTKNKAKVARFIVRVRNAKNEAEVQQSVLPDIFDILTLYDHTRLAIQCGTRWGFQPVFSELLGHPQPDQTIGLEFMPLSQALPRVFSTTEVLFGNLQPVKGIVLPSLTFEIKGPKGVLYEASLQNQHSGACALKNIVKLKRTIGRAAKTYTNRILTLSIEMTTDIVQVTGHWITTESGKDHYWNTGVLPPVVLQNLPEAQRLVRNAIDWTFNALEELIADLVVLESLLNQNSAIPTQKTKRRKRTQVTNDANEQDPEPSYKKRRCN